MKKCLYCDNLAVKRRKSANQFTCKNHKCEQTWIKFNKKPNTVCTYCGRLIYIKPTRLKRSKNVCCSLECSNKLRKTTTLGENNHQYGLKGPLNDSFKGDKIKNKTGYILVYCGDHPFGDERGRIREHRLVAEKFLLNNENSIIIDGKRYLHPYYHVHHIDENKANNDISNLQVLTPQEHTRLHNKTRKVSRDAKTGRFQKTNK